MSDRTKTNEVYQQFLAAPDYKVAEIIGGRAHATAVAAVGHMARWRKSTCRAFETMELDLSVLWAR